MFNVLNNPTPTPPTPAPKPTPEAATGFTPLSLTLRLEAAERTWQELWPKLEEKQKAGEVLPGDFVSLILPLLEAAVAAGKINRGFQIVDLVGKMAVPEGSTIADVVARLLEGAEPKGIAVAVDRCVVPRSEWSTTRALAGAPIEIVTAAAGG